MIVSRFHDMNPCFRCSETSRDSSLSSEINSELHSQLREASNRKTRKAEIYFRYLRVTKSLRQRQMHHAEVSCESSQRQRPVEQPSSPPSRFVRRSHSSTITSIPEGPELPKKSNNRSTYNRTVGKIIQMEMEGQCEPLPNLTKLGYTSEVLAAMFGS